MHHFHYSFHYYSLLQFIFSIIQFIKKHSVTWNDTTFAKLTDRLCSGLLNVPSLIQRESSMSRMATCPCKFHAQLREWKSRVGQLVAETSSSNCILIQKSVLCRKHVTFFPTKAGKHLGGTEHSLCPLNKHSPTCRASPDFLDMVGSESKSLLQMVPLSGLNGGFWRSLVAVIAPTFSLCSLLLSLLSHAFPQLCVLFSTQAWPWEH